VTPATAEQMIAASVDDQFKLIKKGTGSSKFPASVAFEIVLATPKVVQSQPVQPKSFTRSSKTQTAVKATPQMNQIKSSGLQVVGMPRSLAVPN
jgi:hypothetical protein